MNRTLCVSTAKLTVEGNGRGSLCIIMKIRTLLQERGGELAQFVYMSIVQWLTQEYILPGDDYRR